MVDEHTLWIRGELRRRLWRRLAIETVLTVVLLAATLVAADPQLAPIGSVADGPVLVVAGTVLGAAALMAGRIWLAMETNPLHRRFLQRYVKRSVTLVALAADPAPSVAEGCGQDQEDDEVDRPCPATLDALELLRRWSLVHHASVGEVATGSTPHYDLLVSADGLILAAVARASGSVWLLSRLADGRVVSTAALPLPPSVDLVVGTVVDGSAHQLLRAHVALLRALERDGHAASKVSLDLFAVALSREWAAYRAVGRLATFWDHTGRGRSLRLLVPVDLDEIRALGLRHRVTDAASAPDTRHRPRSSQSLVGGSR